MKTTSNLPHPGPTVRPATDQTGGWSDPAMARMASDFSRAALEHLEQASAFLDEGHPECARDSLITSADFAEAIELLMPFLSVTRRLDLAKDRLRARDDGAFLDGLVPVYGSLDEMAVYAPGVAGPAAQGVRRAERQHRRGDRHRAASELEQAEQVIVTSPIYLPMHDVNRQIGIAGSALTRAPADLAMAKEAVSHALRRLQQAAKS